MCHAHAIPNSIIWNMMIKPILFEYTRKICCVVNVIQRNRNKVEEEEKNKQNQWMYWSIWWNKGALCVCKHFESTNNFICQPLFYVHNVIKICSQLLTLTWTLNRDSRRKGVRETKQKKQLGGMGDKTLWQMNASDKMFQCLSKRNELRAR